jgi:hypothetical protein
MPCAADLGHNSDWQDRFSLPIADADVECAVVHHGELYVGGRFEVIGGVRARHIARWDGSMWRDVGGGIAGPVWALAVDHDQIIAGSSTWSGAEAGVMRWDGTSWEPLGDSPPSQASVLLITDSGLVAGGRFQRGEALNVARWDGVRWSAMGAGINYTVSALAEFQGSVYAGGTFDSSGVTRVAGIARWNGASWESVGGGMPAGDLGGGVYHLVVHAGTLVAGGLFTKAGTVDARFLARWDGTHWDSLPALVPPGAAGIGALVSWNDTLYASGGGSPLELLDGDAWRPVDGVGYPRRLAATSMGLIVMGATLRSTTGRLLGRDVLAWDGAWHAFQPWSGNMRGVIRAGPSDQWTPYDLYPPYAQDFGDIAAFGGDLWVMPAAPDADAGEASGWIHLGTVGRWDGDSWHDESPAGLGTPVHILAADDTLIAAGTESHPHFDSNVFIYDGKHWTPLPKVSGWVTALGRWHGSWYVATHEIFSGQALLHRWEGPTAGWQQVLSFGPGYPYVTKLLAWGDTLVCGGTFRLDGIHADNILGYDGNRPFPLRGGPALEDMNDLALFDGRLWCAGRWEGPGIRSPLAVWEHGIWNPVAAPGDVGQLAVYRGHLFGTLFKGYRDSNVMMWDGADWQGLTGSPQWPFRITAVSDGLYVTGPFTSAGGHPDYGLAFWQGDPGSTTARRNEHLGQPCPNPARMSASIGFTLPRSGPVRVTVLDVRGAVVAELTDASYQSGPHFVSWNFTDRNGRAVRPGVYIVRLLGPGGIDEARRLVRI